MEEIIMRFPCWSNMDVRATFFNMHSARFVLSSRHYIAVSCHPKNKLFSPCSRLVWCIFYDFLLLY